MPTLTTTRNYADGATLTEAHLDSAFDSIETLVNTTGLGTDNIQDLAITTAKIDTQAVTTAKIESLAVTTAKIALLAVTAETRSDTIVAKTTTYTAAATDSIIKCDSSAASFTVTLPTAVGISGRRYIFIKTDADTNLGYAVTIDGAGAETIDGAATTLLHTKGETVEIVSDGTNWIISNRRIPSVSTAYTPTFAEFGSPTSISMWWQRVGASIHVSGRFTPSSSSAALGTVSLPAGLTIGTYGGNVDTGMAQSVNSLIAIHCIAVPGEATMRFSATTTNASNSGQATNSYAVAATVFSLFFTAPITGWNG